MEHFWEQPDRQKRLEALKIEKGAGLKELNGDIVYRTHVQTYGTQKWVKTENYPVQPDRQKELKVFRRI